MQILKNGSTGPDVVNWQNFLRGIYPASSMLVTGKFDDATEKETKSFQAKKGLIADGQVGPKTLSVALQLGYPLMNDPTNDENGPSWPLKPVVGPISYADREKYFGKFTYVSCPVFSNPEAITITGPWISNIVQVNLPQLAGIAGAPASCNVAFHIDAKKQLIKLFQDWQDAGLLYLIMTWGGGWSPRFIRGSRTILSNHAWGTAFDINVQWNQLGTTPALKGATGSVRELVEIAYNNGFYWGGWFPNRPDGMHFEIYKLI